MPDCSAELKEIFECIQTSTANHNRMLPKLKALQDQAPDEITAILRQTIQPFLVSKQVRCPTLYPPVPPPPPARQSFTCAGPVHSLGRLFGARAVGSKDTTSGGVGSRRPP